MAERFQGVSSIAHHRAGPAGALVCPGLSLLGDQSLCMGRQNPPADEGRHHRDHRFAAVPRAVHRRLHGASVHDLRVSTSLRMM